MANWNNIINIVKSYIKTNGNQEITGQLLQTILLQIINSVGQNYTFIGMATPQVNPGAPDGPVFYLASEKGVYNNFSGIEVDDELLILRWNNGVWTSQGTGIHLRLEEDIAEHANRIAQNTSNIAQNTEDIAQNTEDIAQNANAIAQNTSNIAQNTEGIAQIIIDLGRKQIKLTTGHGISIDNNNTISVTGLITNDIQVSSTQTLEDWIESIVTQMLEIITTLGEQRDDIDNLETSKQNVLESGVNIKTFDGQSLLGGGDLQSKIVDIKVGNESIVNAQRIVILGEGAKRPVASSFDSPQSTSIPETLAVLGYAISCGEIEDIEI